MASSAGGVFINRKKPRPGVKFWLISSYNIQLTFDHAEFLVSCTNWTSTSQTILKFAIFWYFFRKLNRAVIRFWILLPTTIKQKTCVTQQNRSFHHTLFESAVITKIVITCSIFARVRVIVKRP